MEEVYTVYVLQSEKDGSFYIGQTRNLTGRLIRHNAGAVTSTKARRPWIVVWGQTFPDRSEAIRREKELKKQKSRRFLQDLIK
ncbi:MAG: hypothetical protein A2V83_08725 [Nitrospirae bacterium RBG_16_64_22]|nr:MAG: hypothetical protein A2V83_08725 [Nitrospirae bacterium RBG_16_64_22]